MTDTIAFHRRLAGWRIAGWSAAAALLALPAIAMQFTDEVDWTAGDFVFAGLLLLAAGLAAEFALRMARSWLDLIGLGLAIATAFLTVWSNLAVGIIGAEHEPINLGFLAVLACGLVAAAAFGFRRGAMSAIAGVMAVSQLGLGLAATQAMPGHAVEWGVLVLLALLWLGVSLALRHGSRQRSL
ncbi:hypothetical protein [Aurantiacibacter odishensis]|uniref:hypothetical protein n=1 Tax=Aurantiacibacter odishensis TaxID=1155476 RepID=UPI000E758E00|nr:hypothetical protein [Aurantiacibacter odishensis]